MRFLITLAGMLVVAGSPTALAAAEPQRAEPRPPLDYTVTLALERVSLKDALDEVARRAGVRIAYSRRVVPLDRSVSVQLDAVPVRVALDHLLQGTGAVATVDRTGQILLVTDPPERRANGQTGSIAGTVRDAATGTPLPGARVALVGTRLSAETQADGRYTMADVPPATYRIRARLVGYVPADASVAVQDGQQAVADFTLQRSAIELNPVVAVGYATVEKKDLTGAVASVTAAEFKTQAAPTVTLSSGLQAKAAGVQVTSNSGMPGAGLRVRVRGTGSISANSEPLYVIDGIPAEQGTSSSDPKANPLMSVDPGEIESIDVLKDASATAIYGARGANGVVLITTRRGQRDQTRVTFETSVGFQRIAKTIPVLSGPEFMLLANEAAANASLAQPYTAAQIAAAPTYDYPGMMLRTCDTWRYCAAAPQASRSLTFSGGNQGLRYLLSGNYATQDGIELGSDFRRYGVRLNLDGEVSERFRMGTSLSFTRVARNAPRVENGSLGNSANGIQAAMQFAPFAAPKDANGNWIKSSPSTEPVPNPIANALELKDLNTTTRLLGSVFGEFDVTPALKVRSTLGGNFQFNKIHFFAPRTVLDGGVGGSGFIFAEEVQNLTNENTLTYRRALGPGSVDLLGGISVQTFQGENVQGNGANFPTDETADFNLGSGSQLLPAGSGVGKSAILSYIARANYNIADKYLFTLTGRADGSSRFGANNKWAFFPSTAVAWRLSDESFMRSGAFFDELKLRVSYGQVGSQAVDEYQSLTRLNTQWYTAAGIEIPALAPATRMPNPDLRWEQQTQFNVGIDAAFLDHRVTLTLDHYRSVTKDLLLVVPVPSTTGYNDQLRNVGSVRNRGVELSVSTVNVQQSRLTWRSTLNVAANRNRVLDLGIDTALFISPRTGNFFAPSQIYVVKVGQPLGAIFGFQVNGLWQSGDPCYLTNPASNCVPGEYKIVDSDGDSTITAADRVILGSGDPKLYGGLSNSLTSGPFSLDVFLSFVSGNKVVNAGNAYGCAAIGQANERTCVRDRWTPTNTDTDVPRANRSRPRRLYSTFVEDGSYLRLQTLTLSYRLPARWLRWADAAQVYLTGQNLVTLTGYSGFDPDVNSMGGDGRFGGIDIGAYPRTRTWNVGLSATF
ncbi:MAG TPA: TonB-dependent receptor [Gemmatimonadales bacterium]|jgi:TonB-linked SusC/RagA family outer membrane protein|nr:TonB-dependent receptor [Gemmatimonadales bacterium]